MNRLTPKAEREIEESFKLKARGLEILNLIVAEWETDPLSVQCFDLRIVEEAKLLVKHLAKIQKENPFA